MCDACDKRRDPNHVWAPLFLRCRTPALAEAFRVIVAAMEFPTDDLSRPRGEPFTDDRMLLVPWDGAPVCVFLIALLARRGQIATDDEILEMQYGAISQAYDMPIDTVRAGFEARAAEVDAVDVDAEMATFDDELHALLNSPGER